MSVAMAGMMGLHLLPALAAQPNASIPPILFSTLKLFNGASQKLREGLNVLVDKSCISALPVMGQVVDNAQVKLMAGGGVSSPYDPLDTTQYSEEELRAAVGAAED
jgi:hypothetical protein